MTGYSRVAATDVPKRIRISRIKAPHAIKDDGHYTIPFESNLSEIYGLQGALDSVQARYVGQNMPRFRVHLNDGRLSVKTDGSEIRVDADIQSELMDMKGSASIPTEVTPYELDIFRALSRTLGHGNWAHGK